MPWMIGASTKENFQRSDLITVRNQEGDSNFEDKFRPPRDRFRSRGLNADVQVSQPREPPAMDAQMN